MVIREVARVDRTDRRKSRTRAALIGAAQRILATRGTTEVAVQDITDEADVGLGSFYNHFASKPQLFELAVLELLADFGGALDRACAGMDDPAEVVSVGMRLTCRLAGSQPQVARVLVLAGPQFLIAERGLAPQALRDIVTGMGAGRFRVPSAPVALAVVAGSVLAFAQIRLSPDSPAGGLTDADADELAATVLTTLGLSAADADEVAHRPLPVLQAPG
ncbi:TetR/AcrR family transcriptional regulator [Nakamurella sp.]|uniref:TetR/AcrR family transcriptional regulator n=1 Tax=Nakamurella sp. TaxID=1869182 RepID=UPI003B3A8A6F